MILFPNIMPSDFIDKYLPVMMYNMVLVSVDKNKFDQMDTYLQSIGISTPALEIIKYALDTLDVKEVGGTTQVSISNIIKVNEYTLDQLIRLIDYGNSEIRGLGIINSIENYINSHRGIIVDEYLGRY